MPVPNNSEVQALFFIFYIIIGSLFIINLFVGVVISNFSMEKEKLARNTQLTPLQMEYCNTMFKCFSIMPAIQYVSQGNKMKDFLHSVATSKIFDNFIFSCIVINTGTMSISYYG
jgi:hypothetical protein